MGYKPTDEQIAVLDTYRTGSNASVKAYAGAGKTSTLVDAAAATPGRRVIFTAFNKKIITDSSKKFGANVRCQTTHSLAAHVLRADNGWRANRLRAPRIYGRKLATLLAVNDPIPLDGGRIVHPSRLASLALMMVDRFANSGDDEIGWWHLPSVPGLDDREARKIIGAALVAPARRAWADVTNPKGTLRYSHNYYRKEFALTHPRIDCDVFMVDEAQDCAGVLVRLIEDQAEHGAQIITVGDSYQAINGWTGAVDAMDKFDGEQLLLTQSFRFGDAIADEANKWLELLGAEKPMRGFSQVPSRIVTDWPTPDAVLCRTNGAVVKEVIDRLTAGQKVAMLGDPKEITDFTRGASDLMDKGWSGHHDLMAFGSWGQVQEYVDHDDAGADLKVMVDLIDKHGTDVIEDAMSRLATPHRADVVLSTAHKCKGAEWDAVRIGGDFKAPQPDEITNRRIVSREAAMLNYVAITRAKVALDRGSLSWVDEVLAEHREHAGGASFRVTPDEPVMIGPLDDPDVIGRFTYEPTPLRAGDTLGSRVVIETDKGLATIQPLDLDTMHQHSPQALALLVDAARTPIALPIEPEWRAKGMPGPDWIEEDVATVKAAAEARFAEGLRVTLHGTDEEKAKMFGTPIPENVRRAVTAAAAGGVEVGEVVLTTKTGDGEGSLGETSVAEGEAGSIPAGNPSPSSHDAEVSGAAEPLDVLLNEHAPLGEAAIALDAPDPFEWGDDPKRPGSCGAKHKVMMNTYCTLDPHGPDVLHACLGVRPWDDSKCSELGAAPAHA